MANEVKTIWASAITHVTTGTSAQINAAAMSAAPNGTAISSTNTLDYPLADVNVALTFEATPANGELVDLYRRDINFNSTNDEPAPSTTYLAHYCGSFIVSATASAQYLNLTNVPLAKECEFYILNRSTKYIAAGWTMNVIPKTSGTA